MRAAWVLALSALAAACSGSDGSDAGGVVDTGVVADAGTPDSGRSPITCGGATCAENEYCQVEPAGACTPLDGGTCAAPMESCEDNGKAGCTPEQTRRCVTLPATCASAPSCSCLIALASCTRAGARCASPPGMGFRVQCPF